MKTHQLRQSKFLKKEDCDPPIQVTIKEVREENVGLEEEEKMRWVMFFYEIDKGLVLNVENGDLLTEIIGSDDSDNWLGHKIELWSNPNIKFGGKKVGGVRIREAKSGNNPHPNEIHSTEERQKLHTQGYGDAESRPENDDPY
jgi:hypothetical protein